MATTPDLLLHCHSVMLAFLPLFFPSLLPVPTSAPSLATSLLEALAMVGAPFAALEVGSEGSLCWIHLEAVQSHRPWLAE